MPDLGKSASISIEMSPRADGSVTTDLTSQDELVVENITGISTDSYVSLVDEVRRVAAREVDPDA